MANNLDQLIDALAARVRNQVNLGQGASRPNKYVPNQDFELWMQQFAAYCEASHIPVEGRKQLLISLLDFGTAFKAVANLELDGDLEYEEFVRQLEIRFSNHRTAQDYKSDFQARDQRVDESLEDYADCLKELLRKAYPNLPVAQRDELAKDRFLRGVRVPARVLEAVLLRGPETLNEALQHVHQITANLKLLEGKGDVRVMDRNDQGGQATKAELQSLKAELARERAELAKERLEMAKEKARDSPVVGVPGPPRRLAPQTPQVPLAPSGQGSQPHPGAPNSPPSQAQCSWCLQPGHWARECRNSVVCLECGQPGHMRARCPSRYSRPAPGNGVGARPGPRPGPHRH